MTYFYALLSMLMAAVMAILYHLQPRHDPFGILEISTIVFIVYSFEYFLGGKCFPSTSCRPESRQL